MDTPSNFLKLKENLGGWILAHSLKDPFMLKVCPLLVFAVTQCLLLVFTKCLFMVERDQRIHSKDLFLSCRFAASGVAFAALAKWPFMPIM